MQDPLQIDTVPGLPDAPAVAPQQPAADTVDVLSALSQAFGETGRAVREGRYQDVLDQVVSASVAFVLEGLIPALITLFFFYVVYRVVSRVLEPTLRHSKRVNAGVRQLVMRGMRLVIFSFATIMILDQIGMNVGALIAGLGIVGIALGFAARDTLENFISGVTILLDQPFRIGDAVEVEELYGFVEEITLRSTRIRTLDNLVAVLPNTQMIQRMLINHSILGVTRVVIPFGIAYKEYPQQAREVVLAITDGDQRLHPGYPPTVVVSALNDSSVDMELRIFLKDPRLEVPVRFEYLEKVREALRTAEIEIPYPHLQLFVDEAQAFEGTQVMAPLDPPPPSAMGHA
jgi:small conductance mechanosensitive channel